MRNRTWVVNLKDDIKMTELRSDILNSTLKIRKAACLGTATLTCIKRQQQKSVQQRGTSGSLWRMRKKFFSMQAYMIRNAGSVLSDQIKTGTCALT